MHEIVGPDEIGCLVRMGVSRARVVRIGCVRCYRPGAWHASRGAETCCSRCGHKRRSDRLWPYAEPVSSKTRRPWTTHATCAQGFAAKTPSLFARTAAAPPCPRGFDTLTASSLLTVIIARLPRRLQQLAEISVLRYAHGRGGCHASRRSDRSRARWDGWKWNGVAEPWETPADIDWYGPRSA
jgi:hypothetical protein